jgi:diguanylate cyclase (GGDEF)-like protein/PAS domain S-box-containing protein
MTDLHPPVAEPDLLAQADQQALAEADDALRQQRDLFDAVIDQAGALVVVTDRDGIVMRYNRACEELTGVPAERVLGRPWEVIVRNEERQRLRDATSGPSRQPWQMVTHLVTESGEQAVVEWLSRPIVDQHGEVSFIVATGYDITKHRREVERLRRSEANLRLLTDHVNDLMSSLDPRTGALTFVSSSWRTLGYDPPGLVGQRLVDLVHAEDADAMQSAIDRLIREGGPVSVDTRFRTQDGSWLWFESRGQGVLDGSGIVRSIQMSSRDVQRRREVEEELARRALHDPLTGLPNRTLFLDRLTTGLRRAVRTSSVISVVFCDLDGFKMANDTYGHSVGDAVLIEVSARLEQTCRVEDTVARIGGDEFVILVEGIDDGDALERLVERIRIALSEPIVTDEATITVAASLGLASTPAGGLDAGALLIEADRAMYADKRARNGVH